MRITLSRREVLYNGEFVRRFNDGDTSALVVITARYCEKMLSVAFSLLRNQADAEEIVQDTFIRAHRGLRCFLGDCSLASWLQPFALDLSRNRDGYFFRRRQHMARSFDSVFSDRRPLRARHAAQLYGHL